jgi:flagellar motor protein MotB
MARKIRKPVEGKQDLMRWLLTYADMITLLMLYFISLLFLTNFQLGEWVRRIWDRRATASGAATPEEAVLERRARDLQKQAKTLQDQVDRSGIGADGKPVPAPTVRDLSIAQPFKGVRSTKPAQPTPGPRKKD